VHPLRHRLTAPIGADSLSRCVHHTQVRRGVCQNVSNTNRGRKHAETGICAFGKDVIKNLRAVAVAAAMLVTAAHALPPTEAPISRADMGAAWPFTVESGVLGCERGIAIKFLANRKTYSINGTAQAYSKQLGFGWLPVNSIWADNHDIPGTKINIGPLITRGQKLCKKWP